MKLKKMFRAAANDKVTVDVEKRTAEFSFSSELAVERWFGSEVLSHEAGCADMSRLNDGAALLWNHDRDIVIGVVESAEIRGDKRGYTKVRFSENAKAQEIFKDIQAEVLRNVSFGYQVKELALQNPGVKGEDPKYLATKWMPYEVSIVSIPADPTVGLGRSEENEELEVRILNKHDGVVEESREMDIETKKAADKARIEQENQLRQDTLKAERERVTGIEGMGERFGKSDLARSLVNKGASIEDARAAFLEQLGKEQKPVSEGAGDIGLSQKEIRSFSFLRAIQAMMNPGDQRFQKEASFEREASDAAAKLAGKSARGFMVPMDVLRAGFQRDMTAGTSTAGGNTVATNLLAASFIEMLRKKSVLQRAGATVLNGLVGNIAIPRQSGGATAYWVAESGSPTESQQTIDQVAMSPKTLGAYTDFSRKLALQSSIDVESFIRADLAKVLALEIDRAGLYGSGSSNQPTGLQLVSGLNTVDFAGDVPTFAEIIGMETEVAADNADEGTLAYLVNARGRGKMKGTEKTSTSTGQFIWEPGNTMNGYRTEVSNQVSQVSSLKEHYWFGNWADLLMGFWSGLDLMVDPYTQSTSGTIRVVALQDCDIAARHAESFCLGSNLT